MKLKSKKKVEEAVLNDLTKKIKDIGVKLDAYIQKNGCSEELKKKSRKLLAGAR